MTRSRSTDTSQITENEFLRRTCLTSVLRHSKNRVYSNYIRKGSSKKQIVVLSCLLAANKYCIYRHKNRWLDDENCSLVFAVTPTYFSIFPNTFFFREKRHSKQMKLFLNLTTMANRSMTMKPFRIAKTIKNKRTQRRTKHVLSPLGHYEKKGKINKKGY